MVSSDHAFLIFLAVIGFGGQIVTQVILSIFQAKSDKEMRMTLDATHLIVNSERAAMMEKIERLEKVILNSERAEMMVKIERLEKALRENG
jgi:hypothetical protein